MEKTLPKRYKIECAVDEVEYNRILQFMKDTKRDTLAELMRIALRSYMGKWVARREKNTTFDELKYKVEHLERKINALQNNI